MHSIIESLRDVLGSANFFVDGNWDYGAMIEYFVGAVVLCVVISSIFRFLGKLVAR